MKILTLGLDDLFNKQLTYYAKVQIAHDSDDVFSLIQHGYEFDAVLVLTEGTIHNFPTVMRSKGITDPLVMLSGINDVFVRVRALTQGADQALNVPIDIRLLMAFLEALIRRCQGRAENSIAIGDLILDVNNRTLKEANGTEIHLTPREYDIFSYMATHEGLCRKDRLHAHLYNEWDDPPADKIIDVFLTKIRKKLRPHIGEAIKTRWGSGYELVKPEKVERRT